MNQFKNGTLLVAIATVVIALFMLMTDRDTNTVTAQNDAVIAVESETSVSDQPKIEIEKEAPAVEPILATTEKANTEKVSAVADVVPDAEKDLAQNIKQSSLDNVETASEIKAPKGPFKKTLDESESVKAESINAVATSTENDSSINEIAPIWMDQKLGEFKSVAEDEVVFKLISTYPPGSQNENSQAVTGNNGEISFTSISADYYYQQTPMYNGGYYIAPMPAYLMQSTLPLSGKYSK